MAISNANVRRQITLSKKEYQTIQHRAKLLGVSAATLMSEYVRAGLNEVKQK